LLVLPAQLELLHVGTFSSCISLCQLIFEIPSHLKQLDLPPTEFGSLCIPDSVEVVFGSIGKLGYQSRRLEFGRDSCLREIDLREPTPFWAWGMTAMSGNDVFVRLSEGALRRFRCNFEGL
jgi:hypothetical protein